MSFWGLYLSLTCNFNISILESFSTWSDTSVFTFISVFTAPEGGKQVNRIRANYRIGPHNLEILSIIYGTLLGDSHAERRVNGNGTRFSFYQEANHAEYLLWLYGKFANQGYCNPITPKIQTRLSKGGKLRNTIRFHTFTYSSFNYVHEDWYLNGAKIVPCNIENYLTPLALAVWIMDDGSRAGSGLKLSTNSFTFEDTTRLVIILNKLYGIKSSVQSAGHLNQYIIYIWSESMLKLRQLVKPYMVSSMFYKLGDISSTSSLLTGPEGEKVI
jgi:ubiquinol-cytochrome c reductase cytochrome b subunit